MAVGAARLGDMLVKATLITKDQLGKALQQQETSGGRIGTNLVKLGFISEDDITSFLSRQYGVPSINLSHFEIDPAVIKLIPSEIAQKHQVIPINRTGNVLTVAMADPSNIFAIDDIKFMTGFKVEPVVAAETSIKNAINKHYDSAGMVDDIMKNFDDKDVEALREGEDSVNVAELGQAAEEAPVVKLVNLILTDEEAKQFWPVYDRYQKEINAVGDRLIGVIQDYTANFSDLSNDKAMKLVDDYLAIEADRVKVKRAYVDEFAKVLPGRTVARLVQIENKMDAVIRYDLASTIPVVDE